MPEGDTVWNTARVLADAIEGQELTRSDFRVPQLATVDLAGWLVAGSASHGKHLLLRLTRDPDRAMTLHSHLRMDGAWRTYKPGERWTGRPAHLIRVALHAPVSVAVGFHLHELAIVPTAEEHRLIGHLGPDLMGDGWDPAEAVARLAARPDRPIADALLDQRNLAGIGTELSTQELASIAAARQGYWVPDEALRRLIAISDRPIGDAVLDQRVVAGMGTVYRAEVLFLRGVNPWTPVQHVREPEQLLALARRLLLANRDRVERVTTGDAHRGRQLWVYGRVRERCRRCGTPVQRAEMGPPAQERLIYWCPSCQPRSALI